MLSDSSKNAFKMAAEDPQKDIAKKYEEHEIVRLLELSKALTIHRTNFLIPPFKSHFFRNFNFLFWSQDMRWSKNMRKLGLKI